MDITDEEIIDYGSFSLGHLQEIISELENKVFDRRSKEYKDHIKFLNSLFDIYNKKSDSKTYVKIK